MGFTVLPLAMTNGFATDSTMFHDEPLPTSGEAHAAKTFRPNDHQVRHLIQSPSFRVPRGFHPSTPLRTGPVIEAAGPLKIKPVIMPRRIVDEINRRQQEEADQRPYAPSPLPPGDFPPGYEPPETQRRRNIDGNSDETGERGVVIIDFNI